MSVANRFKNASGGYAQAVVDQTRGVLLGMHVERPTWTERIRLGQEIGYVIILVGALGALAFLYQLVSLTLVRMAVGRQLKHLDRPTPNNALGRVPLAFKGDKSAIEDSTWVSSGSGAVFARCRARALQAFLRLCVAAARALGLTAPSLRHDFTFQASPSPPQRSAHGQRHARR